MSAFITTRIITNADLRNGHDGLEKIGKKNKIDIPNLKENEIALFANNDFTAAKMVNSKDEVVYRRPNKTLEIDDVIDMIATGQNQSFEYTKKKVGKSVEKFIYEEYPWLKARHANIAKRRAEEAATRKKAKKSKRTSSSRK